MSSARAKTDPKLNSPAPGSRRVIRVKRTQPWGGRTGGGLSGARFSGEAPRIQILETLADIGLLRIKHPQDGAGFRRTSCHFGDIAELTSLDKHLQLPDELMRGEEVTR